MNDCDTLTYMNNERMNDMSKTVSLNAQDVKRLMRLKHTPSLSKGLSELMQQFIDGSIDVEKEKDMITHVKIDDELGNAFLKKATNYGFSSISQCLHTLIKQAEQKNTEIEKVVYPVMMKSNHVLLGIETKHHLLRERYAGLIATGHSLNDIYQYAKDELLKPVIIDFKQAGHLIYEDDSYLHLTYTLIQQLIQSNIDTNNQIHIFNHHDDNDMKYEHVNRVFTHSLSNDLEHHLVMLNTLLNKRTYMLAKENMTFDDYNEISQTPLERLYIVLPGLDEYENERNVLQTLLTPLLKRGDSVGVHILVGTTQIDVLGIGRYITHQIRYYFDVAEQRYIHTLSTPTRHVDFYFYPFHVFTDVAMYHIDTRLTHQVLNENHLQHLKGCIALESNRDEKLTPYLKEKIIGHRKTLSFNDLPDDETYIDKVRQLNQTNTVIVVDDYFNLTENERKRLQLLMWTCRTEHIDITIIVSFHTNARLIMPKRFKENLTDRSFKIYDKTPSHEEYKIIEYYNNIMNETMTRTLFI